MSDNLIFKICGGYFDTVDDPVIGNNVSGGVAIPGLLGKKFTVDTAQVKYKTNVVYGGKFQYVKFYASSTLTAVVGHIAFWQDPTNSVVTADLPTLPGQIAGIFLGSVTKGNYTLIQTGGLVYICNRASAFTKTTSAIGDTMIAYAGGVMDNVAEATGWTPPYQRAYLGQAYDRPVVSTNILTTMSLTRVYLTGATPSL